MGKTAKNKDRQCFDLRTFALKVYKMNGMKQNLKLTFLIKNLFPGRLGSSVG